MIVMLDDNGRRAKPRRGPKHLNLNEWFGPTLQGEGPYTGMPVSFLRVANCNLTCSWCDTKYTWDWDNYDRSKEVHKISIDEAADIVRNLPTQRIIVSGGEPLSQAAGLAQLIGKVPGKLWQVETNGTKPLGPTAGLWEAIICSPKIIPSAQVPEGHDLADDVIEQAHLKFVIQDRADVDAVAKFIDERAVDRQRVWMMPEGVTPDALTQRTPMVAEAAIELGVNLSSRLHVYAWHEVRGH